MWTTISITLALLINFCSPEIPESRKFLQTKYRQSKAITGFPYQYFKGEVLTQEMVEFRRRIFYVYFMICITVTFSVGPTLGPIVGQAVFPSATTSVERLIPNQQELILNLRGGSDFSEFITKLIYIWAMSQHYKPTEGFQPRPINPHNPQFFNQGQGQMNPRIAPKLQENPVGRNNPGQGSKSSKFNKHPSMDEMANALSSEYTEFQSKYYSDSLPKRFDTNKCSFKKFKELATDTTVKGGKCTRVSVDEARAIVQAKLEKLVIEPTRPETSVARRVNLDYQVQGPEPFTHFDVKTPVGTEILRKQGQTINVEDMAYELGQKIVDQKQRFVGQENGPASSENVGHLVDLSYVPAHEKPIVRETILKGARDQGSETGIFFLNYK